MNINIYTKADYISYLLLYQNKLFRKVNFDVALDLLGVFICSCSTPNTFPVTLQDLEFRETFKTLYMLQVSNCLVFTSVRSQFLNWSWHVTRKTNLLVYTLVIVIFIYLLVCEILLFCKFLFTAIIWSSMLTVSYSGPVSYPARSVLFNKGILRIFLRELSSTLIDNIMVHKICMESLIS